MLFSGLVSCGSRPTPEAVLQDICAALPALPDGRVYFLSAPEDDARHPSDALLATLYGNGALPPVLDEVEDAAFYLAYTGQCEFAVFRCRSRAATEEVAALCLSRIDLLRRNAVEPEALESACVVTRGRWVLLSVCSDPAAARRAFRRAL